MSPAPGVVRVVIYAICTLLLHPIIVTLNSLFLIFVDSPPTKELPPIHTSHTQPLFARYTHYMNLGTSDQRVHIGGVYEPTCIIEHT